MLAEYGGIYQVDKSNYVTMVPQDGTLYRRTTGGGFRPLSPAGRDTFVDTEVGVQYGFRREAGEIVGLDYSQGGAGYSALRTKAAAPAIAVAPLDKQQEYVGRYRSERLIRTDLIFDIRAENGQLGVRSGNWLRRPVFPVAAQADRFVYENGLAQLQFERDAAGQVTGVVLYESGVIRLRRMP
ncbi:hypothetical protein CF70_001110 [Cupriavidus sp. SK-3]|nr:hypothetical protein CF70_001110 [Cupriavidus sp. SK-3]